VIKVNLPGPLRPYADGNAHVDIDDGARCVGDVLAALERRHPGVGRRVTDEQGRIRSHVHVYVGQDRAKQLTDPVDDGAEVSILAAVSGG
jgi:molybdopterin synthase sulfur carrier subunit